jgi:hypothetical protein
MSENTGWTPDSEKTGPDFKKLRDLAIKTINGNHNHPWDVIDNDAEKREQYEKWLEMSDGKHVYIEDLITHVEASDLPDATKDYVAVMCGQDLMTIYAAQDAWENYKSIRSVMSNA